MALLQLVLFGYYLARTMIRAPFMDMLDWIASYLVFREHGGFAAYLWAFHNEHHLVWIRLLTAIDVELSHASGLVFIVAGTAALLGSAAMTGLFFHRHAPGSAAAAWLAPMLFLTAANAPDCGIPLNAGYPIAVCCMIGSIVLFAGETTWRRVWAMPMAIGGAFGSGAALVIWPVLVWTSWRQRAGPTWTVSVAVLGALFIVVYTHGTPVTAPVAGAVRTDLLDPGNIVKMARYFLAFLGLPLSGGSALGTAGRLTGLALLAAAVFAIVRVSTTEGANTKLDRFSVALILISLGCAAVAAIGRSHLEPGVRVPLRYTVMVTPLQIGLLCLALQGLGGRAAMAMGNVAASGFAAALVASQIVFGQPAIRLSDLMRTAVQSYYRGDRDPDVTSLVYPDAAEADRLTTLIRNRGLLNQR